MRATLTHTHLHNIVLYWPLVVRSLSGGVGGGKTLKIIINTLNLVNGSHKLWGLSENRVNL